MNNIESIKKNQYKKEFYYLHRDFNKLSLSSFSVMELKIFVAILGNAFFRNGDGGVRVAEISEQIGIKNTGGQRIKEILDGILSKQKELTSIDQTFPNADFFTRLEYGKGNKEGYINFSINPSFHYLFVIDHKKGKFLKLSTDFIKKSTRKRSIILYFQLSPYQTALKWFTSDRKARLIFGADEQLSPYRFISRYLKQALEDNKEYFGDIFLDYISKNDERNDQKYDIVTIHFIGTELLTFEQAVELFASGYVGVIPLDDGRIINSDGEFILSNKSDNNEPTSVSDELSLDIQPLSSDHSFEASETIEPTDFAEVPTQRTPKETDDSSFVELVVDEEVVGVSVDKNEEVTKKSIEPSIQEVSDSLAKPREEEQSTDEENGYSSVVRGDDVAQNISEDELQKLILNKQRERSAFLDAEAPTEPPVSEEAPIPTEPPVSEEAPIPTEPPVSEEVPSPTEPPVSEEVPSPTEPPVSEEVPIPTEPPVSEEVPSPTEPPVVADLPKTFDVDQSINIRTKLSFHNIAVLKGLPSYYDKDTYTNGEYTMTDSLGYAIGSDKSGIDLLTLPKDFEQMPMQHQKMILSFIKTDKVETELELHLLAFRERYIWNKMYQALSNCSERLGFSYYIEQAKYYSVLPEELISYLSTDIEIEKEALDAWNKVDDMKHWKAEFINLAHQKLGLI